MNTTFSKYKKLIIDKIRINYNLEGCLCKTPISYLLDYLNKNGEDKKGSGKICCEIRCYKPPYGNNIPNYYLYGYIEDPDTEKITFEKSFGSIVSTDAGDREFSILPVYLEDIEDNWYVPSNIFKDIYKFLEE